MNFNMGTPEFIIILLGAFVWFLINFLYVEEAKKYKSYVMLTGVGGVLLGLFIIPSILKIVLSFFGGVFFIEFLFFSKKDKPKAEETSEEKSKKESEGAEKLNIEETTNNEQNEKEVKTENKE